MVDEVGKDCSLYDIYVDEFGNEGIIAYIHEDSAWKYIIAISADEGYEPWGPMGEAVYKPDGINFDSVENNAIFTYPTFGLMMLQSMKSMGINRFPAQQWCDRKNQGDPYPNAASWRLPSCEEFYTIMGNTGLNDALISMGGTPLDEDHFYWTCTEDIDNYMQFSSTTTDYDMENRAIHLSPRLNSYINKDYWLKKNKYYVRAIKYVYLKMGKS